MSDTPASGSQRTRIGLSNPQQELVAEASVRGDFEDVPSEIGTDHRRFMGVFAAPGVRALAYVLVDGEPWPKTSEFRDLVTFQGPETDARVDIQPFGEPASVKWRPDAGETDASVSLDLHQLHHDEDGQYLATADADEFPHLVVGWHEIPRDEDGGRDD